MYYTLQLILGLCTKSVTGQNAAVIIGVVCSLVFLIVGVLLGVVSVYLILRVRGRLSGPTSPSPPPLPPPATCCEGYYHINNDQKTVSSQCLNSSWLPDPQTLVCEPIAEGQCYGLCIIVYVCPLFFLFCRFH